MATKWAAVGFAFAFAVVCKASNVEARSQSQVKTASKRSPVASKATSLRTGIHGPNLIIRKAAYGNLPDGTAVDVTEKVRAMVKNGTLSVLVSDDNFGDPTTER